MLNAKRTQGSNSAHFIPQGSNNEKQTSTAEVVVAGILAKHNLPFATADHLGLLLKRTFLDLKIAKAYSCGTTKISCILNCAIILNLQVTLIDQMERSCFNIVTDGSNDQGHEKMNSITVWLFTINQHKVVTKFYDICLSKSSTAFAIFSIIDRAMLKNDIAWNKCVSLAVDNALVNKKVFLLGFVSFAINNTARSQNFIVFTGLV